MPKKIRVGRSENLFIYLFVYLFFFNFCFLEKDVPMTFDLRVDPPEKCHMVYPCVMTRKHPKNVHENGILMLLVPGNLDLFT